MPRLVKTGTGGTGAAVTTAEAKRYWGLDSGFSTDDTLVDEILLASRQEIEQIIGGPVVSTQFYWYLERFPRWGRRTLQTPIGPVISIDDVEYVAEDDTTHTYVAWASTNYHTLVTEGVIRRNDGVDWPDERWVDAFPVRVKFTAGYASPPEPLLAAIKVLGLSHYRWRAGLSDKPVARVPYGVEALVAPYRNPWPTLENAT